jgi:iron complex outermembrane receptor protein
MFRLKPLAAATLLGTLFSASAALAQEEQLESSTIEAVSNESATADTGAVEEVVVTGSRLRSSTYSSVSPLQIIDAEFQREVGLIDATDILQNSTSAGGQQIDLTFNGFVLDNGPGSTTISLRGLGANRTLVLMNGRRLAPSGVEGAPSAPNISLVPRMMVARYENLLDAGSSIYGSDAIAGASNIITRKDFDGLEVQVFTDTPDRNGGDSDTIAAAWGFNTDKSVFGIGVEYSKNDRVLMSDRPWTNQCTGNVEITESGEIRRQDLYYANLGYPDVGQCSSLSLAARTFVPDPDPNDDVYFPFGSIYYTPGTSNGGWPNFSESGDPFLGVASDGNGDGVGDINFLNYNLNGAPSDLASDLRPKSESMNILAYGETTLDGDMNITPYFEAMYNTYEVNQNSGEGQLFPEVPALNPYNLCNPNQPDGVDCGLAYRAYLDNPGIQQQWINEFGATGGQFRDLFGLGFVGGQETGPLATLPIVSVRGDRNLVDVEMEQMRFVAGVSADLPFLDMGSLSNWRGDFSIAYNRSEGDSARYGVREDRLELALGYYSSTSTPCENDLGATLASDTAGCVPVNMYAPSLYPVGTVTGDFATQAERDYLFDSRDFNTVYEQTLVSLVLDGDIFEMPGGEMAKMAIGYEYRNDDIQSNPDAVARDGLFWGFFSDKGAFGDVSLNEVFGEIELPLRADMPLLKELTINLSGRLTDHDYYGENDTASVKVGYRPTEPFLVRATWGTAFRAPNNRELFLLGSTGFTNVTDPCYIPESAIANDPTDPNASGGYNPELDQRDPELLANCRATGVDPTLANNGGFNTFSTEVQTGGSLTLDPEESESYTYGFAYEQDFSNKFDLSMGMTYYSVKVENTVIEPSTSFIISDCLFDEAGTGASVFCDRIQRDLSDPTDPRIQLMDLGFINRDLERARGIDYNLTFRDVIDLGVPVDLSVNLTANRNLERSLTYTNADGSVDFEDYSGEWGLSEWRALGQVRLSWDRWTFNWQTRYLGAVSQDVDAIDEFSDAFTASDTCLGPPDDELCRDYGETGSYMVHNVSMFYRADSWTLGMGVRNLEDKAPPLADPSEVTGVKSNPIGYGYDVFGRTFFLNASYNFDLGF